MSAANLDVTTGPNSIFSPGVAGCSLGGGRQRRQRQRFQRWFGRWRRRGKAGDVKVSVQTGHILTNAADSAGVIAQSMLATPARAVAARCASPASPPPAAAPARQGRRGERQRFEPTAILGRPFRAERRRRRRAMAVGFVLSQGGPGGNGGDGGQGVVTDAGALTTSGDELAAYSQASGVRAATAGAEPARWRPSAAGPPTPPKADR